jgi:glucose-1-phosphate adenylyltransferase
MEDVLCLILGGGRGTRLYPLTKRRSEPAVPVAGKYRLIDIPISNCINSGLHRIYVVTQFLSVSLHRHIANTYKFDPFSRGFVEVLAAQQTNEATGWYEGTADALRQNIPYIHEEAAADVLVLSGDQLFRMDFQRLLHAHREARADVTIAVVPVTRAQTANLGILQLGEENRVLCLVEKPATAGQLDQLRTAPEWLAAHGIASRGREHLANMGIYLFSRQALNDLLQAQPTATDLVREILPGCLNTHRVKGYLFDGYWADLGTIQSYHEASLALAGDNPPFDFHSPEGVIYTRMRNLPASRVRASQVEQCLISDGCLVETGTRLERCIIGVRSRIGRGVTMRSTVLIGADRYETEEEMQANRERGIPGFGIGDGSVIEQAIIDKDTRIGRNVQIVNRRNLREADEPLYVIRDGIVVIPNATVVPDGTVI